MREVVRWRLRVFIERVCVECKKHHESTILFEAEFASHRVRRVELRHHVGIGDNVTQPQ